MLPELFRLPIIHLPVHTYGVMMVTGFLAALYISYRQGLRQGMLYNDALDFGFWALLGGILGARIVFIMVEWRSYFIERPFVKVEALGINIPAVFALWQGGLVFWGSMIGGAVAFWIFCQKRGLPKAQFADLMVIGIPLAQVFGRIGCVAAGCCYGSPYYHIDAVGKVVSDLPLAMRFPMGSLAYNGLLEKASPQLTEVMHNLGTTPPLFPSQLAEAFGAAGIFFVLLFVSTRKWFHGQVLLTYAILYSVMRSILELYRGDAARGYVIPGVLSTSQFISILVVGASIIAMLYWRGQNQRKA